MEGEGGNSDTNAPLPIAGVQQAAREAPATAAPIVRATVIVPPPNRPSVIVFNRNVPMPMPVAGPSQMPEPEPIAGPSRTPEPVAGPSRELNPSVVEPFALFPGARPEKAWRRQPYDTSLRRQVLKMYSRGMNGCQIRRALLEVLGEEGTPKQSTINKWIRKHYEEK